MTPQANDMWQSRVRSMLADGLGSEDIAVKLGCARNDVVREVQILRDAGEFPKIRAGETLKKLMGERND